MQRDKGSIRISTIVILVLLGAGVYVGVLVGGIYYRHMQVKSILEVTAEYLAKDTPNKMPIRKFFISRLKEAKIYQKIKDSMPDEDIAYRLKTYEYSNRAEVSFSYQEELYIPYIDYRRTFYFEDSAVGYK